MPMILSEDVVEHRDWLLGLATLPERGAFLDLGCGNGADLIALAKRSAHGEQRFVGLDASEKSISEAVVQTKDPWIQFRQERLEGRLPVSDQAYDLVYSSNLLECLADPELFAGEVGRILKPGGFAVINHWDWDSQVYDGNDKGVVRRLVHAFADWQQAWMDHAEGWMGRRLWGIFNGTGLFEGVVHARALTNTVYAEPLYGHARAQDFTRLPKRGLATAEDVAQFIATQEALAKAGKYFYSVTSFAFVGRRRDA